MVGIFLAQTASGVRVAVTGAGQDGVFHATALEKALRASFTEAAAKAVAINATGLSSDLHATAAYRAALIPVLTAKAVAAAR
jgi:carbon-monoxide dehydrogenase medium subunit